MSVSHTLVLGLVGCACGIFVAYICNRLLQAALPGLPFGEMLRIDLPLDLRVLLYSGLIAILTSLMFGLLPAMQSSRYDLATLLRAGAGIIGSRMRWRLTALSAQIAVSLVLLLTAGLFARAALRLQNTNPGFATHNRLFAPVFVPSPQFTAAAATALYETTLNRVRQLPGIRNAALSTRLPLYAAGMESSCIARDSGKPAPTTTMTIGSGYLNTMRIPLLEGRDFNTTDQPDSPPVAIVNETLRQRLWPHESPLGRGFLFGCDHPRTVTVVGVAHDSRIRSLNEAPLPHVYVPFSQAYTGSIVYLVVETAADPGPLMEPVRKTLVSADPDFRTYGVSRLTESVDASFWQVRFEVWVLGIIGALALVLASVGMYGMMAYHVTARTREIGIRMALGAQRSDVFRLVVSQGVRVTLAGIAAGPLLSATTARLLASLLYGVSPTDATAWCSAIAVWMVVAPFACWLPAHRATHVDPLPALRDE